MTIFATDQSHYDGTITSGWVKRAMAEGISIFTHKLGEGTGGEDAMAAEAFSAYLAANVPVLGPYWVVRSGAVGPQVDAFMKYLNRDIPSWDDQPDFFIQCDLEKWEYDQVPASVGINWSNEVAARTGRTVALYASHGQYGSSLTAWKGILWNADYVAGSGGFKELYPGDNWKPDHGSWNGGWTAYSGQTPKLLQYTSKATIAGLTTSDASAYRGTLDEFKALIGGEDMADLTEQNLNDIADRVWSRATITNPPNYSNPGTKTSAASSMSSIMNYNYEDTLNGRATQKDVDALQAEVTSQGAKLDEIIATLATLGGSTTGTFNVTGTLNVEGQS